MKNVLGLLKGVFVYRKYVMLNIFSNSLYVFFSLFSFVLIIPFISVLEASGDAGHRHDGHRGHGCGR